MEAFGQYIDGSRFKRAFCLHCETPMRVTECHNPDGSAISYCCTECGERDHLGCSSPPSPHDKDAYGVSTQDDYGDIKGV